MKKSRTRKLFPADEKLQNEIARRLKTGLPLAGLVAAALACGGCGDAAHERPPHVVGKMTTPEERRNVPEKRTPLPEKPGNSDCESLVTAGVIIPKNSKEKPDNSDREAQRGLYTAGERTTPPPNPNAKREKEQPPRLLGAPLPPKKNP